MEKITKTLTKINKVVNIVSLVVTLCSSVVSYANGNTSAAIAWTWCSIWIVNVMMTERVLEKTEALNEELKKQK